MNRRRCLQLLCAAPLLAAAPSVATLEALRGRVMHVGAGNRFKVRTRHRTWEVRLAGVRLPGFEPYDAAARSALARAALGEPVDVQVVAPAAAGRADLTGHATVMGQDLAARLVAEGLLRADRRQPVMPELLEREAEARAAGRGMWADVRATP